METFKNLVVFPPANQETLIAIQSTPTPLSPESYSFNRYFSAPFTCGAICGIIIILLLGVTIVELGARYFYFQRRSH